MTARRWPQPIPRAAVKSRERSRQRLVDAYVSRGTNAKGMPIIDVSKLLKKANGK